MGYREESNYSKQNFPNYIRYQSPDCPDYVMLLVAILGFNRRAGQVLKAAGGHNARQPHSLITEVFCPGAEATEQR